MEHKPHEIKLSRKSVGRSIVRHKKGTPNQCWGAFSKLKGGSTGPIARFAHFRRGRKIDPTTIVKHVEKFDTLMALNVCVSVKIIGSSAGFIGIFPSAAMAIRLNIVDNLPPIGPSGSSMSVIVVRPWPVHLQFQTR